MSLKEYASKQYVQDYLSSNSALPEIKENDEGKLLGVVDSIWDLVDPCFSDTAKALLITILRSMATSASQISNIDELEIELFGEKTSQYSPEQTAILGTGELGKMILGEDGTS